MKDNKQINNTSKKTYFNINLLNQYINALLVNVNNKHTPNHVNLIFDSGAVNGLLGIGAALYIHHLQKKLLKLIKYLVVVLVQLLQYGIYVIAQRLFMIIWMNYLLIIRNIKTFSYLKK